MSGPESLPELRAKIDRLDEGLGALLSWRFDLVRRIQRLKAAEGLPPADLEREARVLARARSHGGDVEEVFRTILAEGKRGSAGR